MNRVAVIDTGLSNVDSVVRAAHEVGAAPYLVAAPSQLGEPDHVILPGVGSFARAASALLSTGLGAAITEQVNRYDVPILGICLGMQLLATAGSEGGATDGLDLVPGRVERIQPVGSDARVPHVGWNEVDPTNDHPIFRGIDAGTDFYFVHSYRFLADDPADVAATTPYAGGFSSVVVHENVIGVQFHPEKSHRAGLRLLRNFVGL